MFKIGSVQFVEDLASTEFHRVNFIVKSKTGPSWDITVTMNGDDYEGTMGEVGSNLTPFALWGNSVSDVNRMIFAVLDSQEEHLKGPLRDPKTTWKILDKKAYDEIENDFRLMKQDVIAAMSKVFQIYE